MRITPFEMLIYMTIGYPTNEISLRKSPKACHGYNNGISIGSTPPFFLFFKET